MITSLRLGLLLILLTVTSYYVVMHVRLLQIGHPITQDEPGFVEITAAGNAYTPDGLLAHANVYGPSYAWWARPFTALIANPYVAHRVASSLALLAMLAGLAWVVRREGVGGLETAAGLAIVYILNVSSHSLAASADLLGAALYFGALAVSRRGRWPALLTGVVLIGLAGFTKPYFGFAWLVIASHLLLFGPPRRALAYLGLSALLGVMTVGVLRVVAPDYFLSTVGYHSTVAVHHIETLRDQGLEFALLTCGLLVLALLAWPRRRTVGRFWREPLLNPPVDFWTWTAILSAALLLGWLGWHPGNYLVYFYHLLLTPLVIVALRHVSAWPRLGRVLLCVNLLVLGWQLPPLPANDGWATLAASVGATHGPVLADPLLQPFTRTQPLLELTTHGQTASILQAFDQVRPQIPEQYQRLDRELVQRAEQQAARIRAREFTAIYLCYSQSPAGYRVWSYDQKYRLKSVFDNYEPTEEISVFPYGMPYWSRLEHGRYAYHVVKWVPKK